MTNPEAEETFEPTHVVTGPLAIVEIEGGPQVYLYEGGVLPQGVSDETIEHLESAGLVRPLKDGAPLSDEEWEASRRAKADESERERSGGDVEAPHLLGGAEPPLPGESKVRWVDYAVSKGMDHETAMGMTKGELIERYGAG